MGETWRGQESDKEKIVARIGEIQGMGNTTRGIYLVRRQKCLVYFQGS